MGNGQHRNRRGSRPRPAPHKHGGAGNPGRAVTQLIPPTAPANVTSGDLPAHRDTASENPSARTPESAFSSPDGAADDLLPELNDTVEQGVSSSGQTKISEEQRHDERRAPQPERMEAEPAKEPTQETQEANGAQAPASTSPTTRTRFYAPGQGARPERVERAAPPNNLALPVVVNAPPIPPKRIERIEREPIEREPIEREPIEREPFRSAALDEDDGAEYTGPRGDIRGSVGALIDSLKDVFARDRTIASQGGVARCGVCYLHFPTAELIYRDAEGFYVCSSCSQALGVIRVPMVRRQRQ
jgi:hypothetical protein